jgi:hypothetical protein
MACTESVSAADDKRCPWLQLTVGLIGSELLPRHRDTQDVLVCVGAAAPSAR